jgi:hypothetical protein
LGFSLSSLNCFSAAKPTPRFEKAFLKPPAREMQGCEDVSYQPHLHGQEIGAFENGPDFEIFKKNFIAQFDEVIQFAEEKQCHADLVRNAFETLKSRLFDQDNHFYGKHKHVMYGAGKRALDELASLLYNEGIRLELRCDAVVQLAKDIGACAEGAATHLARVAGNLTLLLGGDDIYRFKQQACNQLMLEYIKQYVPREFDDGYEIHDINRLNNVLAGKLGFPKYEDRYANSSRFTNGQVKDCLQYILKHMTPARLAAALADECLSKFDSTMQSHFAELKNGDTSASFSNEASRDALEAAMLPIRAQCGDVDLYALIHPMDDIGERFSINKDATVIALGVMRSLYERKLTDAYLPKTFVKYSQDNVEIAIKHYGAQLIWSTENGNPALLTVEHLCAVSPYELNAAARLAACAAIKNSSPAALLELFPSKWLEAADMSQLIPKMLGETLAPFLEKHQSKLSDVQRIDILKNIVACGDVPAFHRFMVNNRTLFQRHRTAEAMLSHLWPSAIRSENTEMLDAVTNFVLGAITPSVKIPFSFLDRMETVLRRCISSSFRMHKKMDVAGLFQMGTILTKAWEHKIIGSAQLASMFVARDLSGCPAFSLAMERGNSEQVSAFGKVLLQAANQGALDSARLFTLLEAADNGYSALSLALKNNEAATLTAFGEIVLSAYELGFLNSKQVDTLMACHVKKGENSLDENLCACGKNSIKAYGKILLGIDAIKERSRGAGAFTARWTSRHDGHVNIFGGMSEQDLSKSLGALNRQIKSLRSEAASGRTPAKQLESDMEDLQVRIHWMRICLFLVPKQWQLEKDSRGVVYAEIMREWGALLRIKNT